MKRRIIFALCQFMTKVCWFISLWPNDSIGNDPDLVFFYQKWESDKGFSNKLTAVVRLYWRCPLWLWMHRYQGRWWPLLCWQIFFWKGGKTVRTLLILLVIFPSQWCALGYGRLNILTMLCESYHIFRTSQTFFKWWFNVKQYTLCQPWRIFGQAYQECRIPFVWGSRWSWSTTPSPIGSRWISGWNMVRN